MLAILALAAVTTLQPRDLNGDGTVDAFYDPGQNISLVADANLAGTQGAGTDPNTPGGFWRFDALGWVQSLNFYGVTGWRLPAATSFVCDPDNVQCKPATSELSVLGSFSQFANVKDCYWLSNLSPGGSWSAGYFTYFATSGFHGVTDEGSATLYAWAVHDGDVGATAQPLHVPSIPEPATWTLLLGALMAIPLRFVSRSLAGG